MVKVPGTLLRPLPIVACCCGVLLAWLLASWAGAQPINSEASRAGTGLTAEETKHLRVGVTDSAFDNVPSVLESLGIQYRMTSDRTNPLDDFNVIFVGCSTSEMASFPAEEVQAYVKQGGVLYVSDLSSPLVDSAFPEYVQEWGSGDVGTYPATVQDAKLAKQVGKQLQITFDGAGWAYAARHSDKVKVLMTTSDGGATVPILLTFNYGKGRVVFTSFHNHANANAKLIAGLISTPLKAARDIRNAALGAGIGNADDLKQRFSDSGTGDEDPAPPKLTPARIRQLPPDDLLAALPGASPEDQQRILEELHARKKSDATQALCQAIHEVSADLQETARDLLAKRLGRLKAKSLKAYLVASADPELKVAAARAAAAKADKTLVGDLIGLLGDAHLPAGDAAHQALVQITGQDFGPFVGQKAADRFVVAKKWRTWSEAMP